MPNPAFKSVDEYIASKPEAVQPVLQRLRAILREALPSADEVISYQMPAYKLYGRVVIYFAGWKEHYSIYPAVGQMVSDLADELAPYHVSKGTLRFALSEPIPARLISRIAKYRAGEIAAKMKPAAAKKR